MSTPNPTPQPKVVERKVKAATLAVYLVCVAGLSVVNLVQGDTTLITPLLPDWIEPFVLPLLPALGSLIAGYQAKHTPRS